MKSLIRSARWLAPTLGVLLVLVIAAPAQAAFGIADFDGYVANADGSPATQAGAHPDSISSAIHVRRQETEFGAVIQSGSLKTADVELPAGFVGDPTAVPRCSPRDFTNTITAESGFNPGEEVNEYPACSNNTVVGYIEITVTIFGFPVENWLPVYNLVPPPGMPAQFGFDVVGTRVRLNGTVAADPSKEGGYAVAVGSFNTPQALQVTDSVVTLWGNPASASHDALRGTCLKPASGEPSAKGPCPVEASAQAFLRNPTECSSTPTVTRLLAESWQEPGVYQTLSFENHDDGEPAQPVLLEGCERLPFRPVISAKPTSTSAESPTGLSVDLHIPQNENPEGLATADLKDAIVTLPQGMAVNPASANGLAACTNAQIGLGDDNQAQCPDGSKLGTVEVATPLLDSPLQGAVYLARQGENKFGSLLAMYLVAEGEGVVVKLPGRITTDPQTGRVTASFEENPQLPFEDLRVEFFGGSASPLITPSACGTYTTTGEFTPWSGTPPVTSSSSFDITTGPNGQPCPNGSFDPRMEAGTTNPTGGASSPFVLRVSREDGTQGLSTISATLPKGLLASLKGIPYCPDSALAGIPTAEGTGAGELANPGCPAASKVGSVSVGAGAGPSPFYVNTGSAYLAGPYKGAPLSLAIVTPALAGPFDLGNVVVRTALRVDPETTQVTADSDPLPTILDGIPLDLRDVRVNIDRADFTRNPTNCAEQQITSTIGGTGGAQAHPSSRFEAANCEALPFKPKLSLRLKGKTKRAGHPALTATLTFPKGINANTARAQVGLPHSEFLDQGNIGTVCTRPQLAAHACPAKSVYGRATAVTPLLDQPLTGPVYLGTGYGTKLPMLVAELNGQIGTVILRGKIDTDPQGGIRATFAQVPDAPISRFTLQMQGGPKKGLIENSTDVCRKRQKAVLAFGAQNGKRLKRKVPLGVSCKGKAKGKGKKK